MNFHHILSADPKKLTQLFLTDRELEQERIDLENFVFNCNTIPKPSVVYRLVVIDELLDG